MLGGYRPPHSKQGAAPRHARPLRGLRVAPVPGRLRRPALALHSGGRCFGGRSAPRNDPVSISPRNDSRKGSRRPVQRRKRFGVWGWCRKARTAALAHADAPLGAFRWCRRRLGFSNLFFFRSSPCRKQGAKRLDLAWQPFCDEAGAGSSRRDRSEAEDGAAVDAVAGLAIRGV